MVNIAYSMQETVRVADEGAKEVTSWLEGKGYKVLNVENDKTYQDLDIDLIVTKLNEGRTEVFTVEIKVDRYTSGNFFFEITSNKTKGTPGCILYTNSDYIIYYFIKTKELYVITTCKLRKYLLTNQNKFTKKECTSLAGKGSYQSEGLLIPKATLEKSLGAKKSYLK